MNLKTLTPGTVLLIGALSLSAGWLAGRNTAPAQSPANANTARQRAGARPPVSADDVAPFTGELRRRLATQPPPAPATGRNPFAFGPRRSPGAARDRGEIDAVPPAAPPEPVPFTPPEPVLKLSGIASSQVDGVAVLTAIINDNGTLAFAVTGDKLPSGATVIKIEESGVVIVDAAGITQTLRFK